MRETPLSTCEKQFLLQAIAEKKRLDGRQTYDYRNIKISFGTDYGCCIVEVGQTRVLGQVSCELALPKMNRPTEGVVHFNLELSPMASPVFEAGRNSELCVKLNQLLERCFRNSKCIDTESLCVVSGEKVWHIRVDIHLLNHDGDIIDAASIAAIAALSHFRRPDASVQGDEVTVYSLEERDPIPLCIHHMPICVSFAFFQQGKYLLVDPTEREERVKDGLLVVAMNKHREICIIQSSGGIMLFKDQVLKCCRIASVKVAEITELIQKALENDIQARKRGEKFGFAESLPDQKITALKMDVTTIDTSDAEDTAREVVEKAEPPMEVNSKPVVWAPGTVQIGEGIENAWGIEDFPSDDEEEEEVIFIDENKMDMANTNGTSTGRNVLEVISLSDSEEEDVMILEPEGTERKEKRPSNINKQKDTPFKESGKKKKTKTKKFHQSW
ncbi:exosome complex component RRP45 [Protopterus annectens]|uniref:exosome complex component RRP45 n=1 Tax=Protopterus annectens TaxID=7888 RepID=UPI001CF9E99A|nr:exosome complex component RRP45 [Protopterus annectens]